VVLARGPTADETTGLVTATTLEKTIDSWREGIDQVTVGDGPSRVYGWTEFRVG
jgi:hypothetical protein